MGRRYTWIKALITTENRDRPGGHGHTYVTDGMGWSEPYSPAGAQFLKRRTRRNQRREHARITREAIHSFYEDNDYGNYLEYLHNNEDDYHDHDFYREEDPHDRIIKHEDVGKSLGEILEEIQARRLQK